MDPIQALSIMISELLWNVKKNEFFTCLKVSNLLVMLNGNSLGKSVFPQSVPPEWELEKHDSRPMN